MIKKRKHSEETKLKMSLIHKKLYKENAYIRKNLGKGFHGKHTEETKKKISLALKGKNIGNTWGYKTLKVTQLKI